MVGKCQLEVRITHPEQGRESAIATLLYCLEDRRFWDILEPTLQEAFRHSVQEFTGNDHDYEVTVREHDLLRHIREKAERYAPEA